MKNFDALAHAGLFDKTAPRYTSYPPANHFAQLDGDIYTSWLQDLGAGRRISLYVHIPFCERLCYFCACRTSAANTTTPLIAYLEHLRREAHRIARCLPAGAKIARLHWGGGTPTILPPILIAELDQMLRAAFDMTEDLEFSVEIDPACVDTPKLEALVAAGLTRASIGIQDFEDAVQKVIGRPQSLQQTQITISTLRRLGIRSINADLVYGLPKQTRLSLDASLQHLMDLGPERIALYGYAHVPWMAKRQQLIPNETLPDTFQRYAMARFADKELTRCGYIPVGIDHFAMPHDTLALAAQGGRLRRNFQGYTDDPLPLVSLGASAISCLPQGYAQNAPATPAYANRIQSGNLATTRGHVFTSEDIIRAAAIESLMCTFKLTLNTLDNAHSVLHHSIEKVSQIFQPFVTFKDGTLIIRPQGKPLTRLICQEFDTYNSTEPQKHSAAI